MFRYQVSASAIVHFVVDADNLDEARKLAIHNMLNSEVINCHGAVMHNDFDCAEVEFKKPQADHVEVRLQT